MHVCVCLCTYVRYIRHASCRVVSWLFKEVNRPTGAKERFADY